MRWRELNEQTTANRYQIAFLFSYFNHHHENLCLNQSSHKTTTTTAANRVLYFDLHCFFRRSFTFVREKTKTREKNTHTPHSRKELMITKEETYPKTRRRKKKKTIIGYIIYIYYQKNGYVNNQRKFFSHKKHKSKDEWWKQKTTYIFNTFFLPLALLLSFSLSLLCAFAFMLLIDNLLSRRDSITMKLSDRIIAFLLLE